MTSAPGFRDRTDRTGKSDRPMVITVAVIGLTITFGLTAAAWTAHNRNEIRLLDQRTREAAAVVTAALPAIQTPLASASELAEATDGADSVSFENLMAQFVESGRPYVSASNRRLDTDDLQPLRVVGEQPKLLSHRLRVGGCALCGVRPGRSGVHGQLGITVLLAAVNQTDSVLIRQPSVAARRIIETTGLTDVLRFEQ